MRSQLNPVFIALLFTVKDYITTTQVFTNLSFIAKGRHLQLALTHIFVDQQNKREVNVLLCENQHVVQNALFAL
jgi:hypothetical protein